jgi:NADH dehydrogenase [ubiquinone] 1 alpha subcomplex assembly factor 1
MSHKPAMRYSGLVHALVTAAILTLMPLAHAGPPMLDFSSPEVVRGFRVINDGVMGGVSTSRLGSADGAMLFEGEVSLENNGGFASFRGPVRFSDESATLLMMVRGDGQRYKLTLKPDDSPGTAQYQAAFVATREWQTLRFEADDFAASYRGRPVNAPRLRFADMRYLGLLIADRQQGAFKVEIKAVYAE